MSVPNRQRWRAWLARGKTTATRYLYAGSLGERLARGVAWASVGTMAGQALGLLGGIFAARILGPNGFGQVGIVRSSVDMLAMFAGLALGATSNKYVAEFRSSQPVRAGRVIGMTQMLAWVSSSVGAGLALCCAGPLARVLNAPALVVELRLSAFALLFGTMAGTYAGVLGGFEAFGIRARIQVVEAGVTFCLVVVGVLKAGVRGVIVAFVVSSLVSCLLLAWAVRRQVSRYRIPVSFAWREAEWPILIHFAVPALLSGLLINPVIWLGNAFLVNAPDGYTQMGLFAACNQWRNAVVMLPGIMGTVFLPILSNLYGNRDSRRYTKALWASVLANGAVAVGLGLPLVVAGPWILKVYGTGYSNGWPVLAWLVLTAVLQAVSVVLGQAIASVGRMWLGCVLNLVWGLSFVGFAYWFCGRFGAVGLAMAYGLSYTVHALFSSVMALRLRRELFGTGTDSRPPEPGSGDAPAALL